MNRPNFRPVTAPLEAENAERALNAELAAEARQRKRAAVRALATRRKTQRKALMDADAVQSLPVPLPPLEEIPEINLYWETTFAWLDKIAQEHQQASLLLPRLDLAIFAKAFRGDLVPQDLNDKRVA